MKKIICLLFVLTVALPLFAQDVITTKTGDEIQSKVLKISDSIVNYKEWSNLEGQTLTMNVTDVFMIKYENGEKDVFQSLTEIDSSEIDSLIYYDKTGIVKFNGSNIKWYDAGKILKINHEASSVYASGKAMAIAGDILAYGGGFALGWGLGGYIAGNKNSLKISAVGAGVLLVAIPLTICGQNNVFRSFDIYNESVTKRKNAVNLSLGVSDTGGLAVRLSF